jgi:hypothetical protein
MTFLISLIGKEMVMTYANIELLERTEDGEVIKPRIDNFLKPLIEQLALKYPSWIFRQSGTGYTYDGGKRSDFRATGFEVLDKREVLGKIYFERIRSGHRFVVENFRVNELRERGTGMKTIHLDKAMKQVGKYFGKKNTNEKLKEALEEAGQALHVVSRNINHKQNAAWSGVADKAKDFLLTKYWDEFTKEYGVNPEEFPIAYTENKACDQVAQAYAKGNTWLVHIDGMDYALQKGSKNPTVKTSEELPAYIRQGIGMLKLVGDRQIVSGVGLRVNQSTFMLLNKEEV